MMHSGSPICARTTHAGEPLRIIHNSAAIFSDGVPLYERAGLIRSRELGDAVATALGGSRAMLLRGHGANVVDTTIRSATVGACLLEEAAELQLRALNAAAGHVLALRTFTPEEARRVRGEFDATGPMTRAWQYYAALTNGAP